MKVNDYQLDILKELINNGVGRAAGTLNQMLATYANLQVPDITIFSPAETLTCANTEFREKEIAVVQLIFKGPFSGATALVLLPDSAAKLVAVLTGEEQKDNDLDALRIGVLTEIGNIILNGVMGSISTMLQQHLTYAVPSFMKCTVEHLLALQDVDPVLLARTRFLVAQLCIEGTIFLLLEADSLKALLAAATARYSEA